MGEWAIIARLLVRLGVQCISNNRIASFLRTAWTTEKRGFVGGAAGFVFRGECFHRNEHEPVADHRVPSDFAGICVASSPDPSSDAYVIERLQALGIRHVRLDYSYESANAFGARFLNALLDASFDVLLHLVQPKSAAAEMETAAAGQEWQNFLVETLTQYGKRVSAVEIGSTVNRVRWAGYTLEGFLAAWDIAYREAHRQGVTLAGPNVSDFEPLYTAGLLRLMSRAGQLPDVYSHNHFVERTIEPEIFDAGLLRSTKHNTIKKARILARAASRHGIDRFWNGYVSWTLPRLARWSPNAEEKQADYLTRYLVMVAASGTMERVYWGALVSAREGLIDDPGNPTPDEEVVTFYGAIHGPCERYRERPAFHALRQFAALIPGSHYEGRLSAGEGLQVHAFRSESSLIHVVWTQNAQVADIAEIYRQTDLDRATSFGRDGESFDEQPAVATESPLYLLWPAEQSVAIRPGAAPIKDLSINLCDPGGQHYPVRDAQWRGMVVARDRAHAESLFAAIHPDKIGEIPQQASLRKARNAIWTVQDPLDNERQLVIKQPVKLRLNKKLVDRFKAAKGRRSWNGACELLRRGIASPRPVAYFERAQGVGLTENWYVCELHPSSLSVREFFGAYASGKKQFEGIELQPFLDHLVPFLVNLHRQGVYFRDLSGGNVMVQIHPDGSPSFSLIDTGRAHFLPHKVQLSMHQRLSDLKRVCHKLDWEGRVRLLEMYLGGIKRPFKLRYRLPFYLYDLKAIIKRRLRRKKSPRLESRA